jgi:ribonuclease E
VIDRTEAMTVVDVNTGRFVGRSNLEETVLRTNLEAAEEVAKQLRLRDIGGIIVIDFIDMIFERNREELLRVFKAALARDKTRTQVFGVSELGLVQMTRKNVSEGLLEAFSQTCDKCEGRGIILTDL